ncbi:MAG: GNAT family N-acetyltransferase [Nitrosopumilaceae archaeon]|jgi:glucosamine-phosphate N-acetyltransferase|uniref:GNAT family N-acetyltransferase n=1 Tax=Candidatus Nitrosomaritimum aestuariumsis TaxID=3342354 RepID=A0AC60VXQ9_9ARCH|nr:GNAT family N-acetyltransferase [Nitrosopumilaceae archaeon]
MNNIKIRELEKEDLWNGFLSSLDSLRKASDIEKETALKIFDKINQNPDHIVAVADVSGKIVGSATLLLESKFIHGGATVGHIEDVVVDKSHQGQKIGEKIIKYLLEQAEIKGCYKTILDCADDVKPFYEKLGFKHNANALRFDHF